jgi:leucyl-tRNA synthetase
LWNFAYLHHQPIAARLNNRAGEGLGACALTPTEAGHLSDALRDVRREMHTNLRQADFDFTRRQFNTVVSAAMKMLNTLESLGQSKAPAADPLSLGVATEGLGILLRLLAPVVPHIAHALWVECGYVQVGGELTQAAWPQVEEDALLRSQITLVLQINGKVRGSISVSADADGPSIEATALASEAFQRAASGQTPKKIIYVAGRLVNVVV